MAIDTLGALYAVAVAGGGLAGYLKAGSLMSLGAGVLFGCLAGFGSYQLETQKSVVVLLGTSVVLGGVMGLRFSRSGKFMPAGLVFFLSLAMVARCVYRASTS